MTGARDYSTAAYVAASAAASFVAGAAVSLLVPGPLRLAGWLGAAGVLAVAGGVAYDTRPVATLRAALRRMLLAILHGPE